MKTFAEKVRENRLSLHLTQEELGGLIGVSKRSVLAYETKGIRPRSGVLQKLAAALGVSAEYLRSDEVEDPLYGLERAPYVEATRARFGEKAAREIDYLMDRNAALFAGGEVTQEQKDAYFEAVMQAYLACKQAARASYGRKKEP